MRKIRLLGLLAVAPMFALSITPTSSFGRDSSHYAPRVGSGYAYNAPRAARGTMHYGPGVTAPVEGYTVCSRPYYRAHLGGSGASCRTRGYLFGPEQK
jgi:hypothetical protein